MPTSDIQVPITHHKVQVDAANNVRTHFATAGEGPKAALVVHAAPRTWNAFRHLVSRPVDAGCRLMIPDHGGADAGGGAAAAGKTSRIVKVVAVYPSIYPSTIVTPLGTVPLCRRNFVTPPFYGDRRFIHIRPAAY